MISNVFLRVIIVLLLQYGIEQTAQAAAAGIVLEDSNSQEKRTYIEKAQSTQDPEDWQKAVDFHAQLGERNEVKQVKLRALRECLKRACQTKTLEYWRKVRTLCEQFEKSDKEEIKTAAETIHVYMAYHTLDPDDYIQAANFSARIGHKRTKRDMELSAERILKDEADRTQNPGVYYRAVLRYEDKDKSQGMLLKAAQGYEQRAGSTQDPNDYESAGQCYKNSGSDAKFREMMSKAAQRYEQRAGSTHDPTHYERAGQCYESIGNDAKFREMKMMSNFESLKEGRY